jgi:asparagine synthase (glutamine-hydrolysing)
VTQPACNAFRSPGLLIFWDTIKSASHPEAKLGGTDLWHSSSGSDWIWADGYIANRAELLALLRLQGASDDREILHHLYGQLGIDAAKYIFGTFSWILWDSRQQALIIVRDRMGNQNYYYSVWGGGFWITNRIDALLELEGFPSNPNPRSVIAQIAGCAPLVGETYYDTIHELEPGGWMSLQVDTQKQGHYWHVEPQPLLKLSSDTEYAKTLGNLLFRVVSEHAPAGEAAIALSSGLDSTGIAAAIRNAAPQTSLTALCWAAPELPEADESKFSGEVCQVLNIPSIQIRADQIWPLSSSEGIQTSAAMPFVGHYAELLDITFQTAQQQGIKIVFSGMSGDHLFGGNVFSYPDLLLTGRWSELTRQIRYHLPRSTMGLSLYKIIRRMILSPIREAYLPRRKGPTSPPVPWLRSPYGELYNEHFQKPADRRWMLPGRLGRLRLLSHPSLPRFAHAMNHQAAIQGVEFRHPMLDHRLIEFALSLPTDQTFRASQRKIIVRNAMRGFLPSSVLDMWDKILPTAICHRGLREREQAKVWRLMTNMRAAEMGFVDELKLRGAYQDYLDGKTDDPLFWHTLTLEDWLRRWF